MSSRRDRQREIADVLSRHGLGYLVGLLGLDRWVPFHHGLLGHEPREAPYTRPDHVRLALEQLGPTFVKLGQILSTRPDLLPPEYQAELVKLQDAAPAVAPDIIREVLAAELGTDLEATFAAFDYEPLAAASIGQAHAATLPDGTGVVVKVRRPGAVEQIEQDLELLHDLAVRASRHWTTAADYDLPGLADEFSQTLRAELDYLREGRNAERFATNFADDPGVHVPRVFWDATTSRVLTLERIAGIKVNDLDALDAAGIDRRALAERATRVTAQMVFRDGFFHADPHPGNFFVESDGRIGIIDFGMVGVVDDRLRDRLASLLVGLTRQDADEVTGALLALGVAHGSVDRVRLRDDLAGLLARYAGRSVGEIPLGPAINDVFAIMRHHHLQVPREVALLLKMVVMDEGMAAQLDPEFRLGDVLAPYARDLVLRHLSPAALARRLGRAGIDTAKLGAELPEQLQRLLAALENGGVEVRLRPDELESIMLRAERLGNRLVAGIIAAAFIDGLAQLMAVDPQRWRRVQGPLAAIGFGAAATLAAYIAWSAGRGRPPTRP
jgi:ubiquinone biosynthesis protein